LENTLRQYRLAVERADRMIAVSQTTKNQIVEHLKFPEDRIDVVYHGISGAFLEKAFESASGRSVNHSTPPYYIALGGTPRKNLVKVVQAFSLSSVGTAAELCILGPLDTDSLKSVQAFGMKKRVHLISRLNENAIVRFYRNANGLIFPSLQEGFGIPILEAMICRIPVLTSNHGAMMEVAGGHAVLIDPNSVEEIANGIDQLSSVSDENLIGAANYARTFSWERSAGQTLAVYRRLVA